MIEIFLIGMGVGNPESLTVEGSNMLSEVDLILLPRKNKKKKELLDVRKYIFKSIVKNKKIVIKEYKIPKRLDNFSYQKSVNIWHEKIGKNILEIIKEFKLKNFKLAFLIWGDPGLYDSTLRIIKKIKIDYKLKIIPGISSIQALTSAHLISLNEIGDSVLITTGRKLDKKMFVDNQKVLVLLDGNCSFKNLKPENYYIWWGAYLGMKKQVLIKGLIKDVSKEISARRKKLKQMNGWIMDTYLVKKII